MSVTTESDILNALNKNDIEGARNIILAQLSADTETSASWDSPQYATDRQVQQAITLDHSRNSLFTYFGLHTLMDRYLLRGKDGKVVENPQAFWARVATGIALAGFRDEGMNHGGEACFTQAGRRVKKSSVIRYAQSLYDIMSKMWFTPATPVLTNIGTNRGLPISCFLNAVDDNMEGITDINTENAFISKGGGGLGTYWGGVRHRGAKLSSGGTSSGIIPFLKIMDSQLLAVSQGNSRRGAGAVYLPVWHPEIEEFAEIRKPTGGDDNRRCLNLNHGIVIDDAFMIAATECKMYDLRCPKTNAVVKQVDAHDLLKRLITLRMETGEPYFLFIDNVNRTTPIHHKEKGLLVQQSNLCVAPETLVLTDRGNVRIDTLKDKVVTVWNGFEWSEVTVKQTSKAAKLLSIKFSDGAELDCTHKHQFHIRTGYGKKTVNRIISADQLKPGDSLIKMGDAPVIEIGDDLFPHPYTHGFYTGDGTDITNTGRPKVALYGKKQRLAKYLAIRSGSGKQTKLGVLNFTLDHSLLPKFSVPSRASLKDRLDWFAGLCDADGCIVRNGTNEQLQIASIHPAFLDKVRLMLLTCGVRANVSHIHPRQVSTLPDGKGGTAQYVSQACYRILVTSSDLVRLKQSGFSPRRLKISNHVPQRNASHFISVCEVTNKGRVAPTYCFTEPKRHLGVFNGVLTGQCSEITLPTGPERTAVCCLGSMNLEKYDEWKFDENAVYLGVRALDNVLQAFCNQAGDHHDKAKRSAEAERSIGLGVMGYHGYLMEHAIPFESVQARLANKQIFKDIHGRAIAASKLLAEERGVCPDAIGTEFDQRNSYVMSIAPTASISIITGNATPCIEPITGNAYVQKTMGGSFLVKNRFLANTLEYYGKDTMDIWQSVIGEDGSVQHLTFLTDKERMVFRTAWEMNQRELIAQAGDRTPFVCQAQSLNLFFDVAPRADGTSGVSMKYLFDVHVGAWAAGVKSLYYLRSRSILKADSTERQAIRRRIETEECAVCQ